MPKCSVRPRESRRPFSPSYTCAWSKHWGRCTDAHERLSHQIAGSGPTLATRTHRRAHTALGIIGVCLCLRLMLSAFSAHQCLHNGWPLLLCEDRRTSPTFICSTPTASYFQRAAIQATVGFTNWLASPQRHHGCYFRPVLDVGLVWMRILQANFWKWSWIKTRWFEETNGVSALTLSSI